MEMGCPLANVDLWHGLDGLTGLYTNHGKGIKGHSGHPNDCTAIN